MKLSRLGPGIITGAADDDPSGIATYSQAGAGFGLNFLWTAWVTFPLMAAVQETCARIGLVTRMGLAKIIKANYPRPVLYSTVCLLFIANVFNIGADISAIAAAVGLIVPINSYLIELIATLGIVISIIYLPYQKIAGIFKWLALVLLAYVITFFVVRVDYGKVLTAALLPDFSAVFTPNYLLVLMGVLGTTISPYLFFWEASEETEELKSNHRTVGSRTLVAEKEDTIIGMLYSNLVTFFIIAVTGSVLYSAGVTNITTAAEAATALRPLAGDFAYVLFAIGIIGTGMLAIPILAGSAGYAVSETFGFSEGLNKKFNQAKSFYAVIIISVVLGFLLTFLGIPPMKYLLYSAVLNGLISPILIVIILLIANNKKIMGERVNGTIENLLVIATLILMTVCAVSLLLFR
jgi:NRAMP (natural resistance-associated macrophage protein)-like metal ion transporter